MQPLRISLLPWPSLTFDAMPQIYCQPYYEYWNWRRPRRGRAWCRSPLNRTCALPSPPSVHTPCLDPPLRPPEDVVCTSQLTSLDGTWQVRVTSCSSSGTMPSPRPRCRRAVRSGSIPRLGLACVRGRCTLASCMLRCRSSSLVPHRHARLALGPPSMPFCPSAPNVYSFRRRSPSHPLPHISPHLPTSPHISPHLAGCLLGARAVLESINSLELVAPEALGDCGGHCLEKRPWWKLGLGRQRRRRLELTEGSTAYAIALSSLAGLGFVSQVRDLHGSPRVSPGSHRISHLDHFLTPLLGLVRPPRRCSRPCSQRSSRAPAM